MKHSATPSMRDARLAHDLVDACIAGEQSPDAILGRVSAVARGPQLAMQQLVDVYVQLCATSVRPRRRDVLRVVRDVEHGTFPLIGHVLKRRHDVRELSFAPPQMQPAIRRNDVHLPPIVTTKELAEWLGITIGELEWFSDLRDLNRRASSSRLGHYQHTVLNKRHGGVRLIEAPQARLKAVQRQILTQILDRVPPYCSAAHGFVKGRSAQSFAAQHVGRTMLLRVDLKDFFPSVRGARVQAVFRTLGYPEQVADLLGGLCTTTTPRRVLAAVPLEARVLSDVTRVYERPHLPQGAPTSPALANLCAFRLDCRLTGLADWLGATYSRYADDLAFSGDDEFARRAEYVSAQIGAIVLEEGWAVQHHKTRFMRQGGRQQLAGLTVNTRVNVPRNEYDQLKAVITNCVRHGPTKQNRNGYQAFRAHLVGRVAWVTSVNPERGSRLRALLDRVVWE